MSAALGIGVRVWVGYVPISCEPEAAGARCRVGMIVDGPVPQGADIPHRFHSLDDNGRPAYLRNETRKTLWVVRVSGDFYAIAEPYLFPFDDGDPLIQETDKCRARLRVRGRPVTSMLRDLADALEGAGRE